MTLKKLKSFFPHPEIIVADYENETCSQKNMFEKKINVKNLKNQTYKCKKTVKI